MSIWCLSILTILWLLSFICCLTNWRELVVKDYMLRGIYAKPPCSCVIRSGLLITYIDDKYVLIGDAITIALPAYMDSLVYRPSIIAVGIPIGSSLPLRGNVRFKGKRGLGPPIRFGVALGVVGTFVTYGKETSTSGGTIDIVIWLITVEFSPTVVDVPALPTVKSIYYSSMVGALLRGENVFFKLDESFLKQFTNSQTHKHLKNKDLYEE